MLRPADMEEAIQNIDRRLSNVEQILPTLATKDDLERFATKQDLERFATKQDLERFATKQDLERYATKEDLRAVANRTDVLFESVQHQIRLLADGISSLQEESRATRQTVESLVAKVEDNSVGLRTLTRELRRKGVV